MATARRAEPRDDLVSALVQAEVDGEKLTDPDVNAFFLLLVVAGTRPARNLLKQPAGVLRAPGGDGGASAPISSPLPSAVEEMLRYVSPVMMFRRTVAQGDHELHGQTLRTGEKLLLAYCSANHDERAFPEPQRFDITRSPNLHIASATARTCASAPSPPASRRASHLRGARPHVDIGWPAPSPACARRWSTATSRSRSASPRRDDPSATPERGAALPIRGMIGRLLRVDARARFPRARGAQSAALWRRCYLHDLSRDFTPRRAARSHRVAHRAIKRRTAPSRRGRRWIRKRIDDLNAAKAAADADDAKTHVTDSDVKSVEEKLMSFASGLGPAERKHFTMPDRGPEAGADVQGFWVARQLAHPPRRGPWGWRWRR